MEKHVISLNNKGYAASLEAMSKAEVLVLRVIAERLERSESRPFAINISIPVTGQFGKF